MTARSGRTPPATRRVNQGRGHRYILDGDQCAGVTDIISKGIAKPNLIGWAANATAGYALDHWDELSELGLAERLRKLERGRYEASDQAKVRGTQVHQLAAELAEGSDLEIPEPLLGHIDSYLRFAEEWHLADELVEVPVINRRWRYMGTLDLIASLRGETWLLDLKTGASGIWPETALQVCAYAHAETWLDRDGTEHPMPPIERAGAVWLRADGYDLVPVDISDETFRVFLYAQQLAAFADAPRSRYVGEAIRPPGLEVVA